jgi:hypothetical protein
VVYKSAYESIYKKYGPKIVGLFFSPNYRTINGLNINIEQGDVINMLGEYSGNNDLSFYSNAFKNTLTYSITSLPDKQLSDMFGFIGMDTVMAKEIEDIIKPVINKIVSDIIDEFSTLKSIKDVQDSRNNFVEVMDKLNYISIYSGDTKISDTTIIKTPLTGFQSNGTSGFTSNYFNVIEYLRNFDLKTTSLFSSSIDFNTIYFESATITNEDIKSILQVFLNGHKDDIFNPLANVSFMIGSEEGSFYTLQGFYDKFDLFLYSNISTTLLIDNKPIRSNKNPIEYETSPSTEVSDLTKSDDIFKIFSSKNKLGTTLNFYR